MNKALPRELAFVSATLALATRRSRFWSGLFAASAVGLTLSTLSQKFNFRGKNVFITGGSRGLGLSLAWNLLDQGANVTLVARNLEELGRGRNLLLADFPEAQVHLCNCDVTDSKALAESLDQAIVTMGSIDLVINNAGSIFVGPFAAMELQDFEAQIRLHLFAVIESTRCIVPYFKQRGGGRILNICSLGGKIAVPHMLPYDASKFALAGFSQGVTAELAADKIVVTTAYPTVMRTGSPIQAVFKGDHEQEFEWFAALDNVPGLSMSADRAAKKILHAVADGRSEIVLSLPAQMRAALGVFLPETMSTLMSAAARLLPKGTSKELKTGAQSQTAFLKNPQLAPLERIAHKNEIMYNQKPGSDAEFNAGVRPRP